MLHAFRLGVKVRWRAVSVKDPVIKHRLTIQGRFSDGFLAESGYGRKESQRTRSPESTPHNPVSPKIRKPWTLTSLNPTP